MLGFNLEQINNFLLEDITWDTLITKIGIKEIKVMETPHRFRPVLFLIMNDDSFYESRFQGNIFERIAKDWNNFRALSVTIKQEIVSILAENPGPININIIRHREMRFSDFINGIADTEIDRVITSTTTISPKTISESAIGEEDE